MPIGVNCPSCRARIKAPNAAAGKRLSCPTCKGPVTVPLPPAAPAAPSPPLLEPIAFAEPPPPPRERFMASDFAPPRPPVPPAPRAEASRPIDATPAPQPQGNSAALGLGITSMVLGVIALPSGAIPCCGHVVAFPVGGLGLILGAVALLVSLAYRGRSIGFPIAGVALNICALGLTTLWLVFAYGVAADIGKPPSRQAVGARIEPQPDPFAEQAKGDGKRALSRTDTLLAIRERRIKKGDRITFTTTSFIVNAMFSDEKGYALSPSWDRKVAFLVVKEFAKEQPVAGTLRIPGVWDVVDADTVNGLTIYALMPYPRPQD